VLISLLSLAESNGVTMAESRTMPVYTVNRLQDGPWLVLEGRRLVASCPDENEARAIMAFMNGDLKGATEYLGSRVKNAHRT
jgi:hypothetical protein